MINMGATIEDMGLFYHICKISSKVLCTKTHGF